MSKKIFYTILSGALLYAPNATAEGKAPTLKISGATSIDMSVNSQKKKSSDEKAGRSPMVSLGSSDLYFTAEGETDSKLIYKWRMNITTIPHTNPRIDRNYIELACPTKGTFQFGLVGGVEDTMSQTALGLIGGAAGVDGTFGGLYNMSSGVIGNVHPIGYTKRAAKVTYATPRMAGFQLGLAYTPNTSKQGRGEAQGIGHDSALYFKKVDDLFGQNNIAAAISYKNTWDDVSLELALTGLTERSRLKVKNKRVDLHNALAYQVGGTIGYKDYSLTASYMDNRKSRMPKKTGQDIIGNLTSDDLIGGNAGKLWDVGVQYTYESWQFAVAYFNSKRKINVGNNVKSDIVTATIDYKVLPGLKLFAEADFVSSKAPEIVAALANKAKAVGTTNNSGKVFLVGARLSF
jgi:predicted porin